MWITKVFKKQLQMTNHLILSNHSLSTLLKRCTQRTPESLPWAYPAIAQNGREEQEGPT